MGGLEIASMLGIDAQDMRDFRKLRIFCVLGYPPANELAKNGQVRSGGGSTARCGRGAANRLLLRGLRRRLRN